MIYYLICFSLIEVALKDCVLSAVLFIIYTNADDTVIFGFITNNDKNPDCWSYSVVSVSSSKEIIFDFRHSNITHVLLIINNDPVEICETFKYLGITTDNKLTWSKHCTPLVSKCRQRLFFFKLLNSFCVKSDRLHLFYTSTIESIITMLQYNSGVALLAVLIR